MIGCPFLVQVRSERLARGQASHSGYRHSGPECAGSSHTLYQVCWRRGVWCCEPFGYGPYCLHPSGCPMEISAVGLSVECTLQKVTLDSVGEVTYQTVGQSGNFTVAQVAFVRARIFLALMFGGFSFYLRYVRSVVLVSRLRGMSLFRTC